MTDDKFNIIKNHKLKRAILAALADEISKTILDSTIDKSKTVDEIIAEKKIPHTSAYRKVEWLLSKQLLFIEKVEKSKINESRFFLARFTNIFIEYRQGDIDINAINNQKIPDL
ncbi:MAG: hypothetical protein R3321_06460 [Nitrososphaeraceae archaeon]|nr:hypothetical protein [Nitrososphaeraceae archaeon]